MSLREELPVEPMSEPRWDRVEQAVFAELDAREGRSSAPPARRPARRAWIVAALGAAVAAAAVLALLVRPFAEPPVDGMYTSRVVTTDDATHTTVGDVSMDVAPRTALVIVGGADRGWVVSLERGSADFAVPPRQGRPPFVVQAGGARVEVVGTRFSVAREGDDVAVEVDAGVVQVTRGGDSTRVRAGERWPAAERRPAGPTAAPRTTEAEPPASVDSPPAGDRHRPGPPPPDAASLFERAQSLEAADPAQATRLYRRVSRGGGPWAANALYAWARLEVERGRTAEARQLLGRYLERHPNGPNATDARDLLARLERTQENAP